MKFRITIAAAALAGSMVSAQAADLPSRKGPPPAYIPPPPLASWTGFYLGLNAGYAFSESQTVRVASAPLLPAAGIVAWAAGVVGALPAQSDGFIGGGQIGYNWQYGNNFVLGGEADIQGLATGASAGRGATAVPFGANTFLTNLSATRGLDYFGTVRGRLGYLVTPTLLLYGTGGVAYGEAHLGTDVFQFSTLAGAFGAGSATFSDLRVGWAAGGGGEWLFMPRWSAKVEYLHYDLGSVTQQFILVRPAGPYAVTQSTGRFDGHVVRAGVNYHLDWGSTPILAKY